MQAAGENRPDCPCAVENPGGFRRRHFADAVADDERRREAAGAKSLIGRSLNGIQKRLRDLRQLELGGQVVIMQRLDNRPAGKRGERLRDQVEFFAKGRVMGIGGDAHADELAAVAGEDEDRRCFALDGGAADGADDILVLVAEPVENRDERPAIDHRHDDAMRQSFAPECRRRNDGVRLRIGGLFEPGRIVRNKGAEGGAAVCRDHEVGRRGRVGNGRCTRAIGNDDMGVGAAETEGVDAGDAALTGRGLGQRRQGMRDLEVERLEVDVGIEFAAVQGRWQFVMFECQHRFEDAAQPGRRLHVADIGLDRADQQRLVAPLRQGLADRGRLDGIADPGPRAVRLDEGETAGVDVPFQVKGFQEARLIDFRWQRDAVRPSVRVDVGPGDEAVDMIAVAFRRFPRAQHEDDATLGADVAVRVGGEGLA